MPRVGSEANACTEVSTPERTRNVPMSDSENARIASSTVHIFSASRFSITTAEWSSAVAAKPRHQRRILNRVPEPEAAPAEFVVGPVRAHRDADGEEHPRRESPRPRPSGPCCVDVSLDQRRDCEGERDRAADVAQMKSSGGMNREADVLQHRVEVVALERRIGKTQERIRRRQDEEKKCRRDPALDRRSTSALSLSGRLAPKAATIAPNSARISTHSSIEPSWFDHTPVTL